MSRAYNKRPRRRSRRRSWWRLGRAGVTSLEFGVVALLFLIVLIGCMDLGRYYLVEHSRRTIAAEAARARLVGAIGNIPNPTAGPYSDSFAAIAPFTNDTNLTLIVTQTPSFKLGVTETTATAFYAFTAYSPIWSSLTGKINEKTVWSY
ncbi:MAG TPA: TadE/TadG family type IV pilus assembly protein [Acetobacteraceae bacterium]|nr:TadE/TadG family type IV pilus assembly protein [Acetobacteraceae bacterium]